MNVWTVGLVPGCISASASQASLGINVKYVSICDAWSASYRNVYVYDIFCILLASLKTCGWTINVMLNDCYRWSLSGWLLSEWRNMWTCTKWEFQLCMLGRHHRCKMWWWAIWFHHIWCLKKLIQLPVTTVITVHSSTVMLFSFRIDLTKVWIGYEIPNDMVAFVYWRGHDNPWIY